MSFLWMKRPPNPPILAATGANGSFVESAFLPFDLSDADVRPAWAERGQKRKAWDSLNEVERRVALRLLKAKVPCQLIGGARPATIADVRKHQHSCLHKVAATWRTFSACTASLHSSSNDAYGPPVTPGIGDDRPCGVAIPRAFCLAPHAGRFPLFRSPLRVFAILTFGKNWRNDLSAPELVPGPLRVLAKVLIPFRKVAVDGCLAHVCG